MENVCTASPWGTGRSLVFYNKFIEVSKELGVKLVPPGNKDKEFGPSQQGVVLGVYYDTVDWS